MTAATENPLAVPMASSGAISRACRHIEVQMAIRLGGMFRVTYMPKEDSFIIRWIREDGAKAELDMDRPWMANTGSPFGRVAVFLKHRVSLQGVR